MNRRLSKGKCLLVPASILLMLAIVFCSIIGNFTSQGDKTVTAVSATPGTASVLNLNNSGANQDNFSNVVQGAQNEYIYFGVKSGTTNVLKWRVLTKDSKYSSGNWLLWADTIVGNVQYNERTDNPYYGYWGTSKLRAKLNGGSYLGDNSSTSAMPTLNKSFNVSDSWFYTMFNDFERVSIVTAQNNVTKHYGTEIRTCILLIW